MQPNVPRKNHVVFVSKQPQKQKVT